ncbi:GDSL esterase/lipase APG [Selaginella moellendorffii]|uniref:GDSL esterase/lipase APG n=1 Tax=Selaginella moellendorffii TaxID=88036 RepID=UPI000D1CA81A|nr:GDSL esterase/lipase APG [Selaginella moellendorffii]|eukprot:XP_024524499.1 GDSL esterase/lipase APG [Selaginella moellendorffii]
MSAASFFATLSLIASLLSSRSRASQLVPALYVFGDSSVDAGNNDYIGTVVRADFPPYGRDFDSHKATGRFSNGRVSSDYLASLLGLPLPPPYLDPSAKGSKIIQGVNFATAGSGLYEKTAALLKLVQLVGQNKTAFILSKAFIVLSSGSNDYINNYYFDPALRVKYTKDAFRQVLIFSVENFVKALYHWDASRHKSRSTGRANSSVPSLRTRTLVFTTKR